MFLMFLRDYKGATDQRILNPFAFPHAFHYNQTWVFFSTLQHLRKATKCVKHWLNHLGLTDYGRMFTVSTIKLVTVLLVYRILHQLKLLSQHLSFPPQFPSCGTREVRNSHPIQLFWPLIHYTNPHSQYLIKSYHFAMLSLSLLIDLMIHSSHQ